MNKQCEYNTNGSCIFYDVIYSTIEKVISMLNNDADLHRSRAENARQEYYRIVEDMKNNDNRDYYKQLIKDELERKEKREGKKKKELLVELTCPVILSVLGIQEYA